MDDSKEIEILFRVLKKSYPKGMFLVRRLLNEIKREKELRKSYENDIIEQRGYIISLQDDLYGIQENS